MTKKHTELTLNDIVSVSDDTLCVEMDDERVALNIENNQYFNINDIGSLIWEIIEEKAVTIEQLYQQLCERFKNDDPQIIKTDMMDFIAACQHQETLIIKKQSL